MCSTPLTCCSIGAATVSRTTFALAPGYVQDTCTVGGVISGYWAIGSVFTAAKPANKITAEITTPRTGRSMKNRAIAATVPAVFRAALLVATARRVFRLFPILILPGGDGLSRSAAHVSESRGDNHSGADPLQPVDNHPLAGD